MFTPHSVRTSAKTWVAALLLGLAAAASAQPLPADKAQSLRAAIRSNTGAQVDVDDISPTPVPGIYAVQSGAEIFYTDATGRYSFVNASLIDMKDRKDLTANVMERINVIPFQKLPLASAIKEVHGNGSRSIAVFEDPNCPICRVFSKFLEQIDDVTIYHFMYPVISPESLTVASAAWCSNNRGTVWKAAMSGTRPQPGSTCDTDGLKGILEFGAQNRILETPTVVLGNGKRLVGATPPEQFMQELNASGH